MGRTSFSGPVYGAKATLFTAYQHTQSSGAGNGLTSTIVNVTVPAYEDWYATEVFAYRGSTGSTGLICRVLDDSTIVGTVTLNSSLQDASSGAIVTADGGEYEGARIAAGSVVSFTLANSSVAPTSSNITITLRGFTRLIDSTRAF